MSVAFFPYTVQEENRMYGTPLRPASYFMCFWVFWERGKGILGERNDERSYQTIPLLSQNNEIPIQVGWVQAIAWVCNICIHLINYHMEWISWTLLCFNLSCSHLEQSKHSVHYLFLISQVILLFVVFLNIFLVT